MANTSWNSLLRPYLAPLLLKSTASAASNTLMKNLHAEISGCISSTPTIQRQILTTSPIQTSGGLTLQTIIYLEDSCPAWAPSSTYLDHAHHLVVIAIKGAFVAVCASDPSLRNKLSQKVTGVHPVSRKILEQAFVGKNASVMWLNGVHTQTDVRPNAKTLMGTALEFALDPLGDQSFYYSAVRSRIKGFATRQNVSIGAAPGSGHIWIGRPTTWADFLIEIECVLDMVANPPRSKSPFKMLSQATTNLNGVSGAFDLALVPPELMSDIDLKEADRQNAMSWAYETTFEVRAGSGANLEATVRREGNNIGDIRLVVTPDRDRVKIDAKWMTVPTGHEDARAECEKYLVSQGWPKIYYDTGHTITQGYCYLSAYGDQTFDWTFKSFNGYRVDQEKPIVKTGQSLANSIGQNDKSLFGYVLKKLGNTGWLASDDGSMELADFVHIADDDVVTLIHAKAAKSGDKSRGVSASMYEVVVGQAIKNLRHLERIKLAEALQKGSGKKIAGAVWHNGVRAPDRKGIIARAKALPSNYQRILIVLQPQLTHQEYTACTGGAAPPVRRLKMKQLDTLMLGARLSASAVGAQFYGWAAK